MSLPYSYKGNLNVNSSVEIEFHDLMDLISQRLKNIEQVNKLQSIPPGIWFIYKSLFSIPYSITISPDETDSVEIRYEIKLNKLINVCIALVIFTAFFSSFGMTGFLWFSGILTLSFYAVAVIVVDNQLRNLLIKALNNEGNSPAKEETLSQEQLQWMRDKSKCPACGEEITEYDKNCPECGLKLKEFAPANPSNISKYGQKRIKYFFKEKKKDKND